MSTVQLCVVLTSPSPLARSASGATSTMCETTSLSASSRNSCCSMASVRPSAKLPGSSASPYCGETYPSLPPRSPRPRAMVATRARPLSLSPPALPALKKRKDLGNFPFLRRSPHPKDMFFFRNSRTGQAILGTMPVVRPEGPVDEAFTRLIAREVRRKRGEFVRKLRYKILALFHVLRGCC